MSRGAQSPVKDVIKTGSQIGPVKAERISEILEEFSIRVDEAVYIGDAPSDVIYARRAGIACFSALWGSVVDEEGVRTNMPDEVFFSVNDLRVHLITLINSN